MPPKFIYECQLAGSTTNIYVTDIETVKELSQEGAIVTCKRFKGDE